MSKLAPTPVHAVVSGRRRWAPWLPKSRLLGLCVAAWLASGPAAALADETPPGELIAGDRLVMAAGLSAGGDSLTARVLPGGFGPDSGTGASIGAPAPHPRRGRDMEPGEAGILSSLDAMQPVPGADSPVGVYRWLSRHFKLGLRYSREPFADGLSESRGDDHTVFVSFVGHLD